MLFNFFNQNTKNTQISDESNNILAKITYIMSDKSDSPAVDIELKDYDEPCIKGLCDILSVLSEDRFLLETIDIIKNAMISESREDCLLKLFHNLDKHTKSKILELSLDKSEDEPCIKPSDVFMNR